MDQLDVTRITDRIFAMGMLWIRRTEKKSFRNNVAELSAVLNSSRFKRSYLIYNLSFVPTSSLLEDILPFPLQQHHHLLPYDPTPFHNQVMLTPFPSRHPTPPLDYLFQLLFSMQIFHFISSPSSTGINSANQPTVFVHCHNGRSKTSIFISCYLRYAKFFPTANDAFEYFIEKRADGDRSQVTVSQKRFLRYFDDVLSKIDTIQSFVEGEEDCNRQKLIDYLVRCETFEPLQNPLAKVDICKVVVNLGWRDLANSGNEDIELHLEIFEKGQLIWASHSSDDHSNLDIRSNVVTFHPKIDLVSSDDDKDFVTLHADLHFRLVLHSRHVKFTEMRSNASLIAPPVPEPIVSRMNLASFTCHAAFLPSQGRLRVTSSEMDVTGFGHASAHKAGGGGVQGGSFVPLGKIGDSFFMDLYLSTDDAEDSTQPQQQQEEVSSPGLTLHKLILNCIPDFSDQGGCKPTVEVWRIVPNGDTNQRECVYNSDRHKEMVLEYLRRRKSASSNVNLAALDSPRADSPASLRPRSRRPSSIAMFDSMEFINTTISDGAWTGEEEDPVYVDPYMILFRISCMGIPEGVVVDGMENGGALPLNSLSYEIKMYHSDPKSGARIPILKYSFTPRLMAPGLIRIRPPPKSSAVTVESFEKWDDESPTGEENLAGLELAELGNDFGRFPEGFCMDMVFSERPHVPLTRSNTHSPEIRPVDIIGDYVDQEDHEQRLIVQTAEFLTQFCQFELTIGLWTFNEFHHVRPDQSLLRILCAQVVPDSHQLNPDAFYMPWTRYFSVLNPDDMYQVPLSHLVKMDSKTQTLILEWQSQQSKPNTQTWHPLIVAYALMTCNNAIHEAHAFLSVVNTEVYKRLVLEGRALLLEVDPEAQSIQGIQLTSSADAEPSHAGQTQGVALGNAFSKRQNISRLDQGFHSSPVLSVGMLAPEGVATSRTVHKPTPTAISLPPPALEEVAAPISAPIAPSVGPPPPPPPTMSESGRWIAPVAEQIPPPPSGVPPPPPPPIMENGIAKGPPPPPPPPGSGPRLTTPNGSRKHVRVTLHWDALRQQDIEASQGKSGNRKTIWNDEAVDSRMRSESLESLNSTYSEDEPESGSMSRIDSWVIKAEGGIDLKKFEDLFCVDPTASAGASPIVAKVRTKAERSNILDMNRAKMLGIVLTKFERRFRKEMGIWMRKGDEKVLWESSRPVSPSELIDGDRPVVLDMNVAANMARIWLFRHIREAIAKGSFKFEFHAEPGTQLGLDEASHVLSGDDWNSLLSIFPNESDVQLMVEYIRQEGKEWKKRRQPEGPTFDVYLGNNLAIPELFVYEVGLKEPNAKIFLQSRIDQARWLGVEGGEEGEFETLEKKLKTIRNVCDRLRGNDALKVILRTVLSLGNLTNSQYSKNASQTAVGFKIEALPKLRDVRSMDGKSNLMNYLIEVLWGIPEMLHVGEELRTLLSGVISYRAKDLVDILNEADRCIVELNSWIDQPHSRVVADVLKWHPSEHGSSANAWWSRRLADFKLAPVPYDKAKADIINPCIDKLQQRLYKARKEWILTWQSFYDTAMYFGEDPDEYDSPSSLAQQTGPIQLSAKTKRPEDLFAVFDAFFLYYNDSIKIIKRAKDRERKERKSISSAATGARK